MCFWGCPFCCKRLPDLPAMDQSRRFDPDGRRTAWSPGSAPTETGSNQSGAERGSSDGPSDRSGPGTSYYVVINWRDQWVKIIGMISCLLRMENDSAMPTVVEVAENARNAARDAENNERPANRKRAKGRVRFEGDEEPGNSVNTQITVFPKNAEDGPSAIFVRTDFNARN